MDVEGNNERDALFEEFDQLFGDMVFEEAMAEHEIRIAIHVHTITIEEKLPDIIQTIYEFGYVTIQRHELRENELLLYYSGNSPPSDDLVNFINMLIDGIQEQQHACVLSISSLTSLITGREHIFLRALENTYGVSVQLLHNNTELRLQAVDEDFVTIATTAINEMNRNPSLLNAMIADYYAVPGQQPQNLNGLLVSQDDIAQTVMALYEFIAYRYNGKMPVCFLAKFYNLSDASINYRSVIKCHAGVKHFINEFSYGMIEYRCLNDQGTKRAHLCCSGIVTDGIEVPEEDENEDVFLINVISVFNDVIGLHLSNYQ